jgi:hypothetical protein
LRQSDFDLSQTVEVTLGQSQCMCTEMGKSYAGLKENLWAFPPTESIVRTADAQGFNLFRSFFIEYRVRGCGRPSPVGVDRPLLA